MRALVMAAIGLMLGSLAFAQEQGRLRPPDSFQCDRNHLTSFSGEITHYRRSDSGLIIRMRTDEQTNERFHLRGKGSKLESQFLLNADAFHAEDWHKIEKNKSVSRPGTRATVWVCGSPKSLLVDWNPKP